MCNAIGRGVGSEEVRGWEFGGWQEVDLLCRTPLRGIRHRRREHRRHQSSPFWGNLVWDS